MPISTQTQVAQRIGISGVAELLAALAEVPEEVRVELLVPVVRAGGKFVKLAAQFLAPVDEGNLRDSIDQVEVRYPANYNAVSVVGPQRRFRGLPTMYASQVEYGHVIGTRGIRKGKATKSFIGPRPGFAGFVPAKPFMRPAVEYAATGAAGAMFEAAEKAFDKIGTKLERKYGHKKST